MAVTAAPTSGGREDYEVCFLAGSGLPDGVGEAVLQRLTENSFGLTAIEVGIHAVWEGGVVNRQYFDLVYARLAFRKIQR